MEEKEGRRGTESLILFQIQEAPSRLEEPILAPLSEKGELISGGLPSRLPAVQTQSNSLLSSFIKSGTCGTVDPTFASELGKTNISENAHAPIPGGCSDSNV